MLALNLSTGHILYCGMYSPLNIYPQQALDEMPTPPLSEEAQYFYKSSLDPLYPAPQVQELECADTKYKFDPLSTQALEKIAQIEQDPLNPAPQVQALEHINIKYEFDSISPQGMEEVAEIEQQPTTQISNTEASLCFPLQDGAAAIGEDEGDMEDIEHSGEEMERDEIIIQYLKPDWDYSDINDKILSTISQGMVACILSHYDTRSALWSPKTCFAKLGIKPQFEVTLDDGVSRIILLHICK